MSWVAMIVARLAIRVGKGAISEIASIDSDYNTRVIVLFDSVLSGAGSLVGCSGILS